MNQSIHSLHNQSGFNLVDLLVVIGIIGLVSGFAWPSLQPILSETRAEMFMRAFARDIGYIRTYAISHGMNVTICPLDGPKCKNDWSKDISIFIDNDLNRFRGNHERLLKVIDDPKPGDTFTYPRVGVTFRSDGSINGFQSGTFRYCPDTLDSPFSKGLVVNQAGRPRFRSDKVRCKAPKL